MALKPWHWIALAGLGFVVIAITYLPPDPDNRWRTFGVNDWEFPRAVRASQIRQSIQETKQALRALRLRDSLLPLTPANPVSEDGPVAMVDRAFPAGVRRSLEGALGDEWKDVQPVAGGVTAVVAIVPDSANNPSRRSVFVTPSAAGGSRCYAIHSYRTDRTNYYDAAWYVSHATNNNGLLGPCGFFAAFGRPGAGIEAWLTAHEYRFARISHWPNILPYREISSFGRDCGRGDLRACRQFLDEDVVPGTVRDPNDGPYRLVSGILVSVQYSRDSRDNLLASLRLDMGARPFTRFWQSPLPVDSAFQSAFGISMVQWASRWMSRSALARDSVYWGSRRPAGYGLHIRPSLVLVNLLLVALLVAGGAWFSERRQV